MMLKKITVLLATVIIICVFSGCSPEDYSDYQKITIDKVGTFCVPAEWAYTKVDDAVYFTDKSITETDFKIYLVGLINGSIDKLFLDIEYVDLKSSQVYSNSAIFGIELLSINQEICEISFIEFPGDLYLEMYALDDLVSIDTIKKMAKSYILPDIFNKKQS